jgi:prevent-host-death family protein
MHTCDEKIFSIIKDIKVMNAISTVEAKTGFSELVNRVAFGKERVALTRRGKALAVIIPMEDLEALERLEDASDLRDADAAFAAFKASGKPSVPLEEVARELGITLPARKRR